MAYDEHLAERVSQALSEKGAYFKTVGGLCYLVDDKMAVGIVKDSLMIRIDPTLYEASLKREGCRPMDFTGRVLKGFLLVDPEGIDMQEDLEYWIQLCLDFNPKAKSSRKHASEKKAGSTPAKRNK